MGDVGVGGLMGKGIGVSDLSARGRVLVCGSSFLH